MQAEGLFDLGEIDAAIEADPAVRLLHVQRSCGYQWRPSLPIQEIERWASVNRPTFPYSAGRGYGRAWGVLRGSLLQPFLPPKVSVSVSGDIDSNVKATVSLGRRVFAAMAEVSRQIGTKVVLTVCSLFKPWVLQTLLPERLVYVFFSHFRSENERSKDAEGAVVSRPAAIIILQIRPCWLNLVNS